MTDLKKKSIKGLFWLTSGKMIAGFSSLIVTTILARLLLPESFALVELLFIFISVSNVFIDSGFSQAIIREKKVSEIDLSSVFYFNLVISILLYFLLYFFSPFLADFFHAPDLTNIARLGFLVIIINSLSIIQNAKLFRELNFKAISKASIIAMGVSGTVTIILAYLNFGVWAIVSQMILQPSIKAVSLWFFSNWRPAFVFEMSSIRKFFNFGFFLLLQGLMDAIVKNISSLLIGRFYTKDDLGFYSQGRKLDSYIILPFVNVMGQVAYPITSKVRDDDKMMLKTYRSVFKLVIFLLLPITLFVCVNSEIIVRLLYGDRWIAAGVFLSISCLFDISYPVQILSEGIIKAKGKSKQIFYIDLIRQIIRILIVLSVVHINVVVLALAFTLSGVLGGCIYICYALKLLNYSLLDFLKDQLKTVLAIGLSLLPILFIFKTGDNNPAFCLTLNLITMGSIYVILSILFRNHSLYYARDLLITLIRR